MLWHSTSDKSESKINLSDKGWKPNFFEKIILLDKQLEMTLCYSNHLFV